MKLTRPLSASLALALLVWAAFSGPASIVLEGPALTLYWLTLALAVYFVLTRLAYFGPRAVGKLRAWGTLLAPAIGPIEVADTSPKAIARVIRRNNIAVARKILPEEAKRAAWEFAESALVRPGHHGGNLVTLMSPGRETDLALIRTLLCPRLVGIAGAYFERAAGTRDFVLPYLNLVARHFDPRRIDRGTLVPFHQDYFGFPVGWRVLNCWTLLYPEECGESSPGLDFIPRAFKSNIPLDSDPQSEHYKFLETSRKYLDRLGRQSELLTPSLNLGDVLIFSELALHRTSMRAGATKPRVSAEVRLVAATADVLRALKDSCYALVSGGRIRFTSKWREEAGKLVPLAEEELPLQMTINLQVPVKNDNEQVRTSAKAGRRREHNSLHCHGGDPDRARR